MPSICGRLSTQAYSGGAFMEKGLPKTYQHTNFLAPGVRFPPTPTPIPRKPHSNPTNLPLKSRQTPIQIRLKSNFLAPGMPFPQTLHKTLPHPTHTIASDEPEETSRFPTQTPSSFPPHLWTGVWQNLCGIYAASGPHVTKMKKGHSKKHECTSQTVNWIGAVPHS